MHKFFHHFALNMDADSDDFVTFINGWMSAWLLCCGYSAYSLTCKKIEGGPPKKGNPLGTLKHV